MAIKRQEMTAEERFLEAFVLLEEADKALDADDTTKAGEKLWAAACQAVTGVSQQRGWPCETHHELKEVTVLLSSESEDMQFHLGFAVAEKYVHPHLVPDYQLEGDRTIVRHCVEKLVATAAGRTA